MANDTDNNVKKLASLLGSHIDSPETHMEASFLHGGMMSAFDRKVTSFSGRRATGLDNSKNQVYDVFLMNFGYYIGQAKVFKYIPYANDNDMLIVDISGYGATSTDQLKFEDNKSNSLYRKIKITNLTSDVEIENILVNGTTKTGWVDSLYHDLALPKGTSGYAKAKRFIRNGKIYSEVYFDLIGSYTSKTDLMTVATFPEGFGNSGNRIFFSGTGVSTSSGNSPLSYMILGNNIQLIPQGNTTDFVKVRGSITFNRYTPTN
ncbi:hypothetical protein [Leuconostoc mesenteroides]|uniref:hypothetical protein n=1 Tax=Leuconostoc mesenteroides TaxID=1245 RepID=UPI000B9D8203|nr:hypothetical protein [Leuconostoc mesenteroides]BAX73098.1 putative tagatose-6-phosphate ketose/aldose isomerase [Leuconostoc mesenteroides]